ncbi:metallophosphoesterase [Ensifer sp. ENS02]|uniref:metallophosphoesterase family protein n=1 Tax=Ensifer sp. ENS02 TaxID=2769290 RepID=UPI00177DCEEC|nr:metallophosphoesterase [Ensifer sp. ENS02]MBD9524758.1 metallophosphoesterase [Ensifer sp. ENS02]
MKIHIITDIHHKLPASPTDRNWDSLLHVQSFIEDAIRQEADLIVDLGDRISDIDRKTDYQPSTELADIFGTFAGKRVHLLGNHDVENLTIADHEEIFRQPMQIIVHDLGALRLIAWQPDVSCKLGDGFPRAEPYLVWLIDALNSDSRPAIIASHVPVSGHSQIGNCYFERNPHYATYPDHATIRKAVERTGKVAIWLSGHVHRNTITSVNNIRHLTIQSLSEQFTTLPLIAQSWACLKIEDGRFTLDVVGNDPFHIQLPFMRSGDRPSIPPHAPYSETDRLREIASGSSSVVREN